MLLTFSEGELRTITEQLLEAATACLHCVSKDEQRTAHEGRGGEAVSGPGSGPACSVADCSSACSALSLAPTSRTPVVVLILD